MGWKRACELRAEQKLTEQALARSIDRMQQRIPRLLIRGASPASIERWRRRIVNYQECLKRVRAADWGAHEEAKI